MDGSRIASLVFSGVIVSLLFVITLSDQTSTAFSGLINATGYEVFEFHNPWLIFNTQFNLGIITIVYSIIGIVVGNKWIRLLVLVVSLLSILSYMVFGHPWILFPKIAIQVGAGLSSLSYVFFYTLIVSSIVLVLAILVHLVGRK